MVTAAAPNSAGSQSPGVANVPRPALLSVTSATFESILQGLPFVPSDASGAATQVPVSASVLAAKKDANSSERNLVRAAGSKAPEDKWPAWTATVPPSPATEASTIKPAAADLTASLLDTALERPQKAVTTTNTKPQQSPVEPQQLSTPPTPQPVSLPGQSSASWQAVASQASQPTLSFNEVSAEQDRSTTEKQPVHATDAWAGPMHNAGEAAPPLQVSGVQTIRMNESDDNTQPQRTSVAGSLVQAEIDSVINNRSQAISLAPRSANEAFSLKLTQNGNSAEHPPQSSQPAAPFRNEALGSTKSDTRLTAAVPEAANAAHEPAIAKAATQAAEQTTNPTWNESSVVANVVPRAEIEFAEQSPSPRATATTPAHEVAVLPQEAPRPSVTNEILLQLGGKDQPATVRVLDRAGTVNVSVHAADPDLRASLRSNLGDLASQLTHQGWKTEVVKTQTVVMQSNSSRDSNPDAQRDPGQQHSPAQGERQPQKDRRGNGGQWNAQFEESLSQNSSNSGGSN